MRKIINTIILSVFFLIGCVGEINAYDEDSKKVLYISSYNPNYITFNDQINGLKKSLGNDVIFQIEYMDYKSIEDSKSKQILYDLFESKINNYNKFDAIVLADDEALSFGIENRDTLFKDIPIVFLGVNSLDLIKEAISLENIYGIEENFSIEENVSLINKLHKNKNIVALIDQDEKSSKQLKEFYSLQSKYKDIEFKHISSYEMNKDELKKELSKLSNNEVILCLSTYTNRCGDKDYIDDELKFIINNTKVPAYYVYDFGVDNDVLDKDVFIGGKVVSHYEQGEQAGEMVYDLLKGKIPSEKVISKEDINKYLFDDNKLKYYGIRKNGLPNDSIVINDFEDFIEENKDIVVNSIFIIAGLLIIIAVFICYTIEKKKNEKELIKAKEMAESSNEAKNHFISNMSHEFRTPLTLILSSSNLLDLNATKCTMPCAGSNQNSTRIIRQNCYRLVRLTNNIIDITKADYDYMDLKLSNVNIIYILEAIVDSTISYANSKNINIIFDTDEEEVIMSVDIDKLERIVLNLISNAIKFSNEGGNIYININCSDDILSLSIKDEGIGIDENHINNIFDKFMQVDNTTFRNNEGSGIGLALVKYFVEAHDGTIEVESKVNEGSKFIVKLPIRLLDAEEVSEEHYESAIITSTNIEFSDIYF
ncbi:MAG: sensor histidine kinase [Paraclostridium sp.]